MMLYCEGKIFCICWNVHWMFTICFGNDNYLKIKQKPTSASTFVNVNNFMKVFLKTKCSFPDFFTCVLEPRKTTTSEVLSLNRTLGLTVAFFTLQKKHPPFGTHWHKAMKQRLQIILCITRMTRLWREREKEGWWRKKSLHQPGFSPAV